MTAREVESLLRAAGWTPVRQRGSHVLYRHPDRKERIVVPVHPGDLPTGTLRAILKLAGAKAMTRYPLVLEYEADGRISISAPDLPGCVSWGKTRTEAMDNIREAMELWIEDATTNGEAIPQPGSNLDYVAVAS